MARAVPLLLRLKEEMMMHLGWPAKPLYKHPDKTGFVGFEMRAAPKGSVPIDLIVQFPSNEKAPVLTMQQKIKVLMDFCHLTSELHMTARPKASVAGVKTGLPAISASSEKSLIPSAFICLRISGAT